MTRKRLNQSPIEPHPPAGQSLYKEARFDLRVCTITLSDGSCESRGLMVHPGAVVLVPILDDGRVVMIRNRRWQVGHTLLELPAGNRNVGEMPSLCAQRELQEETGYTADKLEALPTFFAAPGVSTEVMHPYVATGLRHVGQDLELDEEIEVVLLSRTRVFEALCDGTIVDGKTLAVLGRYLLSQAKT
jgi:ADP-ribose pyrophosphatase